MATTQMIIQPLTTWLANARNQRRYQYGLLAAITLLAIALRLYKLDTWSFWIDEIFTLRRVQSTLNFDTIIATWPPLSILLTGGALKLLGISEWTARLVPALIGIGTVPLLYGPTRRMLGTTDARLAVLLLAVSPWHLYWSQNARFYTALLLLYTLAVFAFYFGLEHDRPVYLLASFVLLFFASRERFMGVFFVPVAVAYLLLITLLPYEKPPGLRARNVGLILLCGLAAILFDVFLYFTAGESYFLSALDGFVGFPIDDPFRLLGFITSSLGVPMTALASFGAVYLLLRRSRPGLMLTIAAAGPVLLLLAISPFVFTKDRYVFLTLFCWLMLAASAVAALLSQLKGPARVLAVGVMCMLIVDAGWDTVQYFQINNGNRLDWRGAFALVDERRESGDIVVTTRPELAAYYLGEEVSAMRDILPDAVTSSGRRYWFVVEAESAWPAGMIFPWIRQHGLLIDVRYLRVPEDISLWTYLYDPIYSAAP